MSFQMSVLRVIAVYLCGFVVLRLCEANIFPGPCPDVEVVSDLDITKYLGKWYENSRFFNLLQIGDKCTISLYDQKESGDISVINVQINSLFGRSSSIQGKLSPGKDSVEGKLTVNYPSLPIDITAPYWVVDTDYEKYALVWSCYDFGSFHIQNAWILTREKEPDSSVIDMANAAADKNSIIRTNFMPTDQKNCPEEA